MQPIVTILILVLILIGLYSLFFRRPKFEAQERLREDRAALEARERFEQSLATRRPLALIRTYTAPTSEQASDAFRAEADRLSKIGYVPTNQSWAAGQWGCESFVIATVFAVLIVGILMFIYLLVVKPNGTLTVTYELRAEKSAQDPPQTQLPDSTGSMKTCPMCAEEVKAAAVICRFCRHEFRDETR